MGVNSVSDMNNSLAEQATAMQGGKTQQKIAAHVLKSVLDQQKAANDALLQMMNTSSVTGTGKLIDVRA